jgi:hypothetical protein
MKTIDRIDEYLGRGGRKAPIDTTSEKKEFINYVRNKVYQLVGYKVMTSADAKQIMTAIKKIVKI